MTIVRLAIFATHPIQYQAPLWRLLSAHEDLDVQVVYCCDHGVVEYTDDEFGKSFAWDVPLLGGYRSQIIRSGSISTPGILKIPECRKLLGALRPNCVLVQGYYAAHTRQLRFWSKRLGVKLVVRGEFTDCRPRPSYLKNMVAEFYRSWFYRGVDAFCYIGRDARAHLVKRGVTENRLFFSPYSVDDQFFEKQKQSMSRLDARRELNIPDNAIVFLFSGKMIERKQPLLISEAIKMLGQVRNLYVIALGEGPQRQLLINSLSPNLENRLIAPGFVNQSELAKYFLASDIFILPSQFDSWGLVVNEAMQFGLPVITSDKVGAAADLVVPGETGFVFPVGQVSQLAVCMQHFISDPLLAHKLSRNCMQKIAKYSSQAAADGIANAVLTVFDVDSRQSPLKQTNFQSTCSSPTDR